MNKEKVFVKMAPVLSITAMLSFAGGGIAIANVDQVKIYKKIFPESKPQCIMCHVDKLPKKDDGLHELNAYGKKVKETKMEEKPTEETYQKVGSAEEFEASQKTQ